MSLPNAVVENQKPQCWEDAVIEAVNELFRFNDSYLIVDYPVLITENPKTEFSYTKNNLDNINNIIDLYIDSKIYLDQDINDISKINHNNLIFMIANFGVELAKELCEDAIGVEMFKRILIDTLIKKQKDYGPSNINKFAITGVIIRMYDKIGRLNNLSTGNKVSNIDEPLFDTALDLLGYCSIAYMLVNDTFNIPMSDNEVNL